MLRMPSGQPASITTHQKLYAAQGRRIYIPYKAFSILLSSRTHYETDAFTEASNHGLHALGEFSTWKQSQFCMAMNW
jgi:hypothetical protein